MMQTWLIIGAAIVFGLLGLLITDKTPAWLSGAYGVIFFLTVIGLIAYGMKHGTGWSALAKKYPERTACTGALCRCATFQMVNLDTANAFSSRFSGGIVSVGTTAEAMYIVMPAVVRFLLPTIQLPWAAIASAKPFEAPGWVAPMAEPGMNVQVEYDPGFRGDFIELETTGPRICIRLPLYALEGARAYLPRMAAESA
jgi:hypothetical protein